MSTTVKSSATSAPSRFQRDPERSYVLVQADDPKYESPLEDYLQRPSIVNSGEDMYRMESEDRKVTGHRKLVLLSRSKEDSHADLMGIDAQAKSISAGTLEKDPANGLESIQRQRGILDPSTM